MFCLGNLIRHMAAHDPDPVIQRKQMELKLGRQKKIQMIDGQQVALLLYFFLFFLTFFLLTLTGGSVGFRFGFG